MAKPAKTRFVCQSCGHAEPRWLGRCPECDAWSSLVEEAAPAAAASSSRSLGGARIAAAAVMPLAAVEQEAATRFASGMPLLDRVLGGGVVAGGAVLLAGEPGIGKSTLLLQLAEALARNGRRVLYASAEESTRQLRLRAERLGCGHPELLVAGETQVESILAAASEHRPQALIVDSIQAVHSDELSGLPGSVGQVRACAERLVEHAKRGGGGGECALFLVGHVTKEGSIAGPKSLEHLVDTVLAFEAEGGGDHRVLRAAKNRFGPAGEVALYEMHDSGLEEVTDPSRALLAQRRPEAPGSAVAATLHGSRPLLVEVQALVHASELATPRRVSLGLDGGRVALLLAVLERFASASFAGRDVYLNVVGGLRLDEPAVDLAVAAALLSALHERPLPSQAAFFGEVGLLGEVRPVGRAELRLREAAALGFHGAYTPRADGVRRPRGMRLVELDHVRELAGKL